jgi:DNA-binding HxlR family transcriptional regulator
MLEMGRPNPVSGCPLTAAMAAVGGKWKFIIVYHLKSGKMHFAALRRAIPGISQKVLAEQLRELMWDDIVSRERTGQIPAPVVYALTEYGRRLEPLLEEMRVWGNTHIARLRESEAQAAASD